MCTVSETADGSTSTVDVTVTGDGQTVTVPADGTATATITDTYTEANGSLIVNKTIGGPAAGQQGEIVISVSCNGNAPRGLRDPSGSGGWHLHPNDYRDLPAGSQCTVLETADGSTGNCRRGEEGQRHRGHHPGGSRGDGRPHRHIRVRGAGGQQDDHRSARPGLQGEVRIAVSCNEAGTQTTQPDFVIPAGTPAGTVSMSYPNILAGSTCALTETATGATETARPRPWAAPRKSPSLRTGPPPPM